MARKSELEKNDDIVEEEIDLSEFGIKDTEILNIRGSSEKGNLKLLRKKLNVINDSLANIDEALVNIVINFERIVSKKSKILKKEELFKEITNDLEKISESIFEVVFYLDDLIDQSSIYGKLFKEDSDLAEEKLIELVEFVKYMQQYLDKIQALDYNVIINKKDDLSFILEEMSECINLMKFYFLKIKNVKDNL